MQVYDIHLRILKNQNEHEMRSLGHLADC